MKDLTELRGEIDSIDEQLVVLFEKRMNTVIGVAEYKAVHQLPVLNAGREQAVLDKCCDKLENKAYSEALREWMTLTMALSRREQENYMSAKAADKTAD